MDLKIVDNLEKAKSLFNESLQICEKQPDVWINKGNTLDHLGRHFEALYCYDRAILLDSSHFNSWGNRGLCCWRLSMLSENDEDRKKLFLDAMVYLAIELKNNPAFEIGESEKKIILDF
ncbi:tetratricopeptide repeat protein, partial [Candidatus Woesearchaeota archaeon]|nr:tetratricopeptide repeat protein [Candidatus Woesearchaeota archaeon]